MKTSLKFLFKGLAWGAGVLVVMYLAICLYVTVNKNSIIRSVSKDLSEKIRGKVSIGGSELSFFRSFPNVAVLLKDVKVSDSLFRNHGKHFFSGKEVFLRLSVSRLIKKHPPVKGLEVRGAKINVFTNLDGYTNRYLLQQKSDPGKKQGSSGNVFLNKIVLEDVALQFSDSIKGKFHALTARHLAIDLDDDGELITAKCNVDLSVGGIVFNPFKGGYLRNQKLTGKFPLAFNRKSGSLTFDNIHLRIGQQPFVLNGSFDLSGDNRAFSLKVNTKNAGYETLKMLFPEKIGRSLSLVKLDGTLNVSADVGGNLSGGDPLVQVKFSTAKTAMQTPFMDFTGASFTGEFTNEVVKGLPRKDPNSRIRLTAFSAAWRGIPLTARSIQITDLKDPNLICDINSSFALEQLNEIMGTESIQWKLGQASLNLKYSGPIERNAETPALMSGTVDISNGMISYLPRKVDLKNVQAAMHFERSDFFLDKFRADVFGKQVNMTAEARQLFTLLNTQPNAVLMKWNIDMPDLDLLPYTVLLQKKYKPQVKKVNKIATASAKLDQVLDEGRLELNLQVGKLHFKKFVAKNVQGRISLLQDRYIIHDAAFDHASGSMQLKGSLVQGSNGTHSADIKSSFKGVDVREVFASFQNFGQDGIVAENISGRLNADIQARLNLHESGKVIPSSATGKVKFSLKEGELTDFDPVKKIQQFIFKNRDFENIRFAELKNTLEIKGEDIYINPMEIQSSVLTMFVQGTYSRAGNTDMQIRLPLSNLRKRGKDFNPENIGTGGKIGSSIFLRGKPGDDGNIRFKLDLFNKYGKENKSKKK